MRYQVFEQKSIKIQSPAVTLSPSGRIYINQAAAELLMDYNATEVLLLWDEGSETAAMRPVQNDVRAYRIAYSHKGSGATITAKSFLNWIGYTDSGVGPITIPANWNRRQKALEFEIPLGDGE